MALLFCFVMLLTTLVCFFCQLLNSHTALLCHLLLLWSLAYLLGHLLLFVKSLGTSLCHLLILSCAAIVLSFVTWSCCFSLVKACHLPHDTSHANWSCHLLHRLISCRSVVLLASHISPSILLCCVFLCHVTSCAAILFGQ